MQDKTHRELAEMLLASVGDCMVEHANCIENAVCAFNFAVREYTPAIKNQLISLWASKNSPKWIAALNVGDDDELALCNDDCDNIECDLFEFAKNLTEFISATQEKATAHEHYLVANAFSGKITF